MIETYKLIIDAFLEIPILTEKQQLPKTFNECTEEELSDYINMVVIPHTISFFSAMVHANKDYRDVVQKIINEMFKSPKHFTYYQSILRELP